MFINDISSNKIYNARTWATVIKLYLHKPRALLYTTQDQVYTLDINMIKLHDFSNDITKLYKITDHLSVTES